jgi:cytoskeletal protein RodZ
MSQFGEDLRKEREARGIAIASIIDATKISGRHLVALEEDHFDVLPGGVFNKGIVRSYARVVGLDENAWVDRFMSAYQESGQLKDDDASWIEFAENVSKGREDEGSRPDMRLRWAGVAVLLVLLSALGWFVWRYVSHRISSANSGQHHSMSAPAPVTAMAALQSADPANLEI